MNESDGSVMENIEGFEQSDGTTSLVLKNVDRIIHGGTYAVCLEDEFGVCSCKVYIVVKGFKYCFFLNLLTDHY